jgi:septal ring factor EnvC (AmiA/AmiB activator)
MNKNIKGNYDQLNLDMTRLRNENTLLQEKLNQSIQADGKQKSEIAASLEFLQKEKFDLKKEVIGMADNLRIKESMLNDQNDTIKNIKVNLENKVYCN